MILWLATIAIIIALSSAAVLAVLSIEPPGSEPVERVMAPPWYAGR